MHDATQILFDVIAQLQGISLSIIATLYLDSVAMSAQSEQYAK